MRAQQEGAEQLAQLEEFQRLTVGRELRIIELKEEIDYQEVGTHWARRV